MKNSGQVILFITLIIGAVISLVAVSTGFILTQKMKQVTIASDTAQAFYATDSSIEAGLYYIKKMVDSANSSTQFSCPLFSNSNTKSITTMSVLSCCDAPLCIANTHKCQIKVKTIGRHYNTININQDASQYLKNDSTDYDYTDLENAIESNSPYVCP